MDMRIGQPTSPLDRERIAHIEVGHTNVHLPLARAIVVWFLLTLAAFPIVEWLGARGPAASAWSHLMSVPQGMADRVASLTESEPDAGAWSRLVTANRAVLAGLSAFEDALEDHSPVGRLLRPQAQAVLSGWLGAGNERVYAGHEGWLFYRPDVEYITGRGFLEPEQLERRVRAVSEHEARSQPDPRPAIRQFKRDLEARGIALIIVPTPVKPTVHAGELSRAYDGIPASFAHREASAVVQNASYDTFIAGLRRDNVLVFDPAQELARARDESRVPQYLATDTHWRPEAMQRVAEALAAFLDAHVLLPAMPAPGYRVEPREAQHIGDTAAMLDLPAGQQLYPSERVRLRFVVGPDGDQWRPSRDADVLVLGDSFTNMYSLATMGWGEAAGLVEQLSYVLQRPMDRIVQNDQGANATRALLRRDVGGAVDRLSGKRVVVWQFATRELAHGDWALIELPLTPVPATPR